MCNNLFAYLNRHWVPRAKEEDKKDVYTIYRLTLVVWRDKFFMPLRAQVFEAMMGLITRERNGEGVNTQLIRSITDCCVALGLDEEDEVCPTIFIHLLSSEALLSNCRRPKKQTSWMVSSLFTSNTSRRIS